LVHSPATSIPRTPAQFVQKCSWNPSRVTQGNLAVFTPESCEGFALRATVPFWPSCRRKEQCAFRRGSSRHGGALASESSAVVSSRLRSFLRAASLSKRVSQAATSITGHCGPATSSSLARGGVERYTRFMGWAGLKPPKARFGYNRLRPFLIGRTVFAHTVVST
jgi:hypothetical protein